MQSEDALAFLALQAASKQVLSADLCTCVGLQSKVEEGTRPGGRSRWPSSDLLVPFTARAGLMGTPRLQPASV